MLAVGVTSQHIFCYYFWNDFQNIDCFITTHLDWSEVLEQHLCEVKVNTVLIFMGKNNFSFGGFSGW